VEDSGHQRHANPILGLENAGLWASPKGLIPEAP